jgi:hypothetical protein
VVNWRKKDGRNTKTDFNAIDYFNVESDEEFLGFE